MIKLKGYQGEKLEAAYKLLLEENTTSAKVEKITVLLKGMDPALDRVLSKLSQTFSDTEKLFAGEVVPLIAERLPEKSEKDKKRKKALILLLGIWKNLKSEVARVKGIIQSEDAPGNNSKINNFAKGAKIMSLAKGPLGVVTLAAVAIVGVISILKSSEVAVSVQNEGCDPLSTNVKLPFPVPGLSLPDASIVSGSSAQVKIPAVNAKVDASRPASISVRILGVEIPFKLRSGINIVFDGKSLIGSVTDVNLRSSKSHTLIIRCK